MMKCVGFLSRSLSIQHKT